MGRYQFPLIGAAVLLALSGGCMTADSNKNQVAKPDVTKPGVLPPPQETVKQATDPAAGVVQASSTAPANQQPPAASQSPAVAQPAPAHAKGPSLSKLTSIFEKKVIATEMEVAWRNRIAYLPDPTRNGLMRPGIVGQLFLFGPEPKMEFADPDGTLTVDLIDETPHPAGQKAATAERWQFDKATLRNLRTVDETFGKSYVLFLPWPAYKPDITKVRITARYDPEHGNTLFAMPSSVTIESKPHGTPVWKDVQNSTSIGGPMMSGPVVSGGNMPAPVTPGLQPIAMQPPSFNPATLPQQMSIPLSGAPETSPATAMPLAPGLAPATPGAPGAVGTPPAPSGVMPLEPIAITVGKP